MKHLRPLLLLIMMMCTNNLYAGDSTTYQAVVDGMSCTQIITGSLQCDYRIGHDLVISIVGIGDKDAGITIEKSIGIKGDYYATYGLLHGCIIVKPGEKSGRIFDYAFISPGNGKVFKTWEECREIQ